MSEVKKFSQEQFAAIMDECDQLAELACAFGWTKPAPGAPASLEIMHGQAAALRRAVAALLDHKFRPTLEQKTAISPFLDFDAGDKDFLKLLGNLLLDLCSWIAILEATKIPQAKPGQWFTQDDIVGPRQEPESILRVQSVTRCEGTEP